MRSISRMTSRDRVRRALDASPLRTYNSYLTFSGILPIDLPDGTTGVICPDLHAPAHDRGLFASFLRFLADFGPDIFVSIGDWSDMFALSRHPKALRLPTNPNYEFVESKRCWDMAMEASRALWGYMTLGNHEDRAYRYLTDMVPLLGRVLTTNNNEPLNFHNLMGFRETDNATIIYGSEERAGFEGGITFNKDLHLHHGFLVRPQPGDSARADMDRFTWSVGHGHTHRMGMAAVGDLRCYEFGHMVNPGHAYLAYARNMFINWAPGFATFVVHNGKVHVTPVPVRPLVCADGVSRLSFSWRFQETGKLKVYHELDR
ncbi:MAG: hypothetical protein K2W82_15915 [Candidatus Obscuribacterales bacterium]|nr:hypothetical protein [Candidatus Obscuribacterales bacterium]